MIIFALPLHAAVGELALVDLFGGRRELSIAVLPPPPPLPLVRLARAVSHFALPVPLVVGELPRVYVAAFGTACEGRSFVRSIDWSRCPVRWYLGTQSVSSPRVAAQRRGSRSEMTPEGVHGGRDG